MNDRPQLPERLRLSSVLGYCGEPDCSAMAELRRIIGAYVTLSLPLTIRIDKFGYATFGNRALDGEVKP